MELPRSPFVELRCILYSDRPNSLQHVVTVVTTFHTLIMHSVEIITIS